MSSPLKQNTTTIQNLLNTINSLPEAGGVELPALTNEGSASDLLSGKELIDGDGNIVAGSFTIDSELTTQDNLITQIQTALQGKASAPAAEDLDAELTEQEGLISQLSSILDSKAGGGGNVETCNLQVNAESGCYVYYTTVTNGEMLPTTTTMSSSVANLVVAKNTLVAVRYSYSVYFVTGGTKMTQYGEIVVFSVTADSAVATFVSQGGGSGA